MPKLFAVGQGAVVGRPVVHLNLVPPAARPEAERPIVHPNKFLRFASPYLHRSKSGHRPWAFPLGFPPQLMARLTQSVGVSVGNMCFAVRIRVSNVRFTRSTVPEAVGLSRI